MVVNMSVNNILQYWNERSILGFKAGSNDIVLKQLEIEALCKKIKNDGLILDAGCGNGVTAIEILKRFHNLRIEAFDFSPEMVIQANNLAFQAGMTNRLNVREGNLLIPPKYPSEFFDYIYTERSLINLGSWEEQLQAIISLVKYLKVGGLFLMCESFYDGLTEINNFRAAAGLTEIQHPWHNRYLSLVNIKKDLPVSMRIIDVDNFSSTYYFISRVVNAWVASKDGREPNYLDQINELGKFLPKLELCSQTKLVVIEKVG